MLPRGNENSNPVRLRVDRGVQAQPAHGDRPTQGVPKKWKLEPWVRPCWPSRRAGSLRRRGHDPRWWRNVRPSLYRSAFACEKSGDDGAWRMALGARTWRCKPLSAWAARWQVLPRCNGLATSPAACRSVRRQLRHRAAGIGAGLRRHRQPAVRPAGGALLPRRPRRLPLHAAAPFPRPASAVRVPASQPHRWRVHTATFLELLVKRLCEVWPEVRIILRG